MVFGKRWINHIPVYRPFAHWADLVLAFEFWPLFSLFGISSFLFIYFSLKKCLSILTSQLLTPILGVWLVCSIVLVSGVQHSSSCCAVLSHSVTSNSSWSLDCSPPGSSVQSVLPSKNTGVGCHAHLRVNLPNPGVKPRSPALQVDSSPS